MKALPIAIIVGAVMVGTLASQTKSASLGSQKTPQWSTTILLNDDGLGFYKDKKLLSPRLDDHREAATKFATAFALDRSCKGLTLLLDSRAGFPPPHGQYWLVGFHLGSTKETWQESNDRAIDSFNKHGPQPYVHSDNPWFNWSIEHYSSPDTLGANDGSLAEDSDMSPESAAHRVCMFVKSGGAVFGGSGVP